MDFATLSNLTFVAPDLEKYPALTLARDVMDIGGVSGAAFNAAKEIALDAFIAQDIGFLDMAEVVKQVIDVLFYKNTPAGDPLSLDDVLAMDQRARHCAVEIINKIRAGI